MSGTNAAAVLLFLLAAGTPVAAAGQSAWSSPVIGKSTVMNVLGAAATAHTWDTSHCGDGAYAIGMEVRSGTLVDGLALICATLGPSGEHLEESTANRAGSSGGQPRTVRCPSGKVIHGVKGRSDEVIDQISFTCRSWKKGTGSHGGWTWKGPFGGSGGRSYGPVTCPGAKTVRRMTLAMSGSFIQRFFFTCE